MSEKPTDAETPTGTVGGANPRSGSSDAARGLGGHSKDAGHAPGEPAEYVEEGEPAPPPQQSPQ